MHQMQDRQATPGTTIELALRIGEAAGLGHVYARQPAPAPAARTLTCAAAAWRDRSVAATSWDGCGCRTAAARAAAIRSPGVACRTAGMIRMPVQRPIGARSDSGRAAFAGPAQRSGWVPPRTRRPESLRADCKPRRNQNRRFAPVTARALVLSGDDGGLLVRGRAGARPPAAERGQGAGASSPGRQRARRRRAAPRRCTAA